MSRRFSQDGVLESLQADLEPVPAYHGQEVITENTLFAYERSVLKLMAFLLVVWLVVAWV